MKSKTNSRKNWLMKLSVWCAVVSRICHSNAHRAIRYFVSIAKCKLWVDSHRWIMKMMAPPQVAQYKRKVVKCHECQARESRPNNKLPAALIVMHRVIYSRKSIQLSAMLLNSVSFLIDVRRGKLTRRSNGKR